MSDLFALLTDLLCMALSLSIKDFDFFSKKPLCPVFGSNHPVGHYSSIDWGYFVAACCPSHMI